MDDHPDLRVLNIVIDSGTQMAALFPYLLDFDVHCSELLKNVEVHIHTNNLAGIDELHKVSEYRYEHSAVGRRAYTVNLIGGQQYKRYRATLGEPALKYLERMWEDQKSANGDQLSEGLHEVTMGILTGNWFLGGGLDLAHISLCARNRDHYCFKKSVADNAQYRLLISPLGKILPLSDVVELNKIAASGGQKESYSVVDFDSDLRERTYLVTSLRPGDSLSPLERSSAALSRLAKQGGANFLLAPDTPSFDPGPQRSRDELFHMELPHRYIRQNFERVFADQW